MRKYIFVYFKHKALCAKPEEAIAFIDGLPGISCNTQTASYIHALFENEVPNADDTLLNNRIVVERDGFHHYIMARGNTVRTTGCGRSSISIHLAPADTLEECDAIYERERAERQARQAAQREAALQATLAALNKQRRGWYLVEMTYQQAYFSDGIRWRWKTLEAEVLADSGQDAYDKTIEHLTNNVDNLPDSLYPEATDPNYSFTFAGMRTDDGFSVEAWEEYTNNH